MMTGFALIAGLFLAPLALLVLGHRFRGRSARRRRLFWGATIGYLAGVVIASAAMMLPPVLWTASPAVRELIIFWTMPAGCLLGLGIALIAAGPASAR